jgi:hypothetical protein
VGLSRHWPSGTALRLHPGDSEGGGLTGYEARVRRSSRAPGPHQRGPGERPTARDSQQKKKGTKLQFKSPTAERRHVSCVGVGGDRTHASRSGGAGYASTKDSAGMRPLPPRPPPPRGPYRPRRPTPPFPPTEELQARPAPPSRRLGRHWTALASTRKPAASEAPLEAEADLKATTTPRHPTTARRRTPPGATSKASTSTRRKQAPTAAVLSRIINC